MNNKTFPNEQMYQEIILDHFRNPKNSGVVKNANGHAHDVNTACGDEVGITLLVKKDIIKDVKFDGKGCAISIAATSMLTENIIGNKVADVIAMDKQEVLDLLGVPISGMRLKCALLGFKVLKMAIVEYEGKK
jgi:nitrogen fixation NifU-like protein